MEGQVPQQIGQPPILRHNKTQKRPTTEEENEHFRNLLDVSARDAFARPWHRLERGLRLNRLRMYVEEIGPQCSFTPEEKMNFFGFLQRALDRKLLNTHKIVNYIPEQQKIDSIRGLEVRRAPDGVAKWGFTIKKPKEATGATRRKRKDGTEEEVVGGPSTTDMPL